MSKWTWMVAVLLFACMGRVSAHGVADIRINEILVFNEDNYIDTYGHRVGWIELHNTGHSSLDVGGCYLTIHEDPAAPRYLIPKGDPKTVIGPEGYLVFFAEGTATKGTFHTNFTLDQTGYLALYDQSGKVLVDEVRYDVGAQRPDVSLGVMKSSSGQVVFGPLDTTTPGATNQELDEIPPAELFRLRDPTGGIMAITAMSVVFSALIILYLVFRTIGKVNIRLSRKKRAKEELLKSEVLGKTASVVPDNDLHGEELAAIAYALHQYMNDLHVQESNVITINKVARAYSPWSSKIYGLRQMPNKK